MEARRLRWLGMAWVGLLLLPSALGAVQPPPAGADGQIPIVEGALPGDCASPGLATRDLPEPLPALPEASTDGLVPNLLQSCTGIRPGGQLSNGCTLNFVYADAASTYIGTAGHCTSSVGQRMSTAATGQFGTVVYRINAGQGNDFALIRVDADKVGLVNPTMCVWGGPTGAHAGNDLEDLVLYQYGWGVATYLTPLTRARAHVTAFQNANTAGWVGIGSGGDSGSPLITSDGEAFVIHTHGVTPVVGVVGESGTYIHRALGLSRAAGFNVNVVPGVFDEAAAGQLAAQTRQA